MNTKKGICIGAGPSNLAFAQAYGAGLLLLEADTRVGGLCQSYEEQGGVFDLGGHSFHSHYPEAHELVETALGAPLFRQGREARVFSNGSLIPYPFQVHYDKLEVPELVADCAQGLEAARKDRSEPSNFEEFLISKFGHGVSKHFMLPYNRKIWGMDLKELSCDWVKERVAAPKGSTQSKEHNGRQPLQDNSLVGYPQEDGFETIFTGLAAKQQNEIRLNSRVASINPGTKTLQCHNGTCESWDFLVSSMPLNELVQVVEGMPAELVEAAKALRWTRLRIEFLLSKNPLRNDIQRIYSADPEVPSHKMALNHNSSSSLQSRNHHAIMAEVSMTDQKQVDETLIASKTIDFLIEADVLKSAEDIIWTGHRTLPYGYPVYSHGREEIVRQIREWLLERNIHIIGRFGEWDYINSDECLMRGIRLAQRLKGEGKRTAE
ncbi:MAG: protoporphyrinogen/coproporphyrinogen oxidase [Opitutaceae bacterium]